MKEQRIKLGVNVDHVATLRNARGGLGPDPVRAAKMALAAGALLAQPAPPSAALTIAQAVQNALHNYPSIQVSQEQINAAAAGIRLARTAYLPRVDTLAQVNRATRNNVFGLLLPQSTIPSMSGPVIGSNNLGTAWGSAIGSARPISSVAIRTRRRAMKRGSSPPASMRASQ